MKVTRFIYILMPISIVLSFLWAPSAEHLGDASRIIYFHVPLAWVSVLAFLLSGIFSIVYLMDKKKRFNYLDDKSHIASSIGMVFIILTVITGSIWAKISWGSFWNWDPRETSIIVLLLIYIAYFSLHSALEENENRGKICASYLIFAMVMMPFFIFIIPRMYAGTLHPNEMFINPEGRVLLDAFEMKLTLYISLLSFTILFFYLFHLKIRISNIERKIEEKSYEI